MDKDIALYSAQQSRDLDARAIGDFAIPGYELMQRAANASWHCLRAHWPEAKVIGFLVGPGNNGGDALELARIASAQGIAIQVFLLAQSAEFKAEALQAWNAFVQDALPRCEADQFDPKMCDVWVDGLFGSGLSRALQGRAAQWIAAINQAPVPVLALDLPSGIHADSGAVLGDAVQADVCISFIARKQGLFTGAALDFVGHRVFDDLQLPAQVFDGYVPTASLMANVSVAAGLPQRQRNAHKGSHGHVLLIGGAPGYSGAIRLAAGAALRGGAGLVSVLTHPDSSHVVSLGLPDAMVHGANTLQEKAAEVWERADILVIGPGLGQAAWGRYWFQQAVSFSGAKVIDADALNLWALEQQKLEQAIVTPHPGEAGRLLAKSSQAVQNDRYGAVRELAARLDCVAVLKGAGSLIADPQGACRVCPAGNPGMAVAGMGDVLAGLMGALLAQAGEGADLLALASVAVLAHAQAGDQLASQQGQRGLLASDLIAYLPQVLNA
ncbi:MAG: NAD(P)H-hydrate dehydratase [Oceanococcus sp.]